MGLTRLRGAGSAEASGLDASGTVRSASRGSAAAARSLETSRPIGSGRRSAKSSAGVAGSVVASTGLRLGAAAPARGQPGSASAGRRATRHTPRRRPTPDESSEAVAASPATRARPTPMPATVLRWAASAPGLGARASSPTWARRRPPRTVGRRLVTGGPARVAIRATGAVAGPGRASPSAWAASSGRRLGCRSESDGRFAAHLQGAASQCSTRTNDFPWLLRGRCSGVGHELWQHRAIIARTTSAC